MNIQSLFSTSRLSLAAAITALLLTDASAQTTLVSENWQSPLLSNNTAVTNQFSGWTFNGGAISRRRDASAEIPGDTSVAPTTNQAIELNQDTTYGEINIAHNWAATDTYYLRVEASPASWQGHLQRYVRPELREQDGTLLWQAPADATTAVPLYNSYMNSLTDYPSELTFFFQINASAFSGAGVSEGNPLRLRLDASGQRALYINNVSLVLGPLPPDTTPPAPDPLTWDVLPTVSNFRNISMRIRSARDGGDLYGVQYYFENLTNGTNSGWQNSREWAQTGLDYNTTYTYRVKARDKSPNANESTTWSAEQSATTPVQDLTPPTPDPLTWATLPTVADYRSITMTANVATDPNGVEYYFENVTNSTNSGWIASRSWTQKDLSPATQYTYRVKARDKSLDQNETPTWSTEESATTPTEPAGTLLITRFQDPIIADNTGSPNLGNWVRVGGDSIKMQWATGDGVRTDTSIAATNQAIQFEYETNYIEYNLPHNWSVTDTFTLTLNASPQSWSGELQRYVRPSLREQDGTVLWAPGENMSGPERTAVPLYSYLDGSSYQSDDGVAPPAAENGTTVTFTYTIPASAFSGAGVTPGQPIRLRIGQSGQRGLFIDNVHLSVSGGAYTVTYDDNDSTGGTVPVDSNTYANGATVTVLGNTGSLVRTGFVFAGWNTLASGLGTQYAATGSATFTMGSANVTLYAEWKTPYEAWATGSESFTGDANGDGVKDGIAFLLGAATPGEDANGRLPTATEDGNGNLVLSFNCLPVAARGGATLKVAHSASLGSWTSTVDEIPDATDPTPDNNVTFVVGDGPAGPPALKSVTATIDEAAAAGGGKLFGRLEATE